MKFDKRLLFMAFIFIYTVLAAIPWFTPGWKGYKEIFPFASWNLFSFVQNTVDEYRLEFTEAASVQFDKPRDSMEMSEYVKRSISQYFTIQSLGKAVESRDEETKQKQLVLLRKAFMKKRGIYRFELVRVKYDPLIKYRTSEIISRKPISVFEIEVE